jgi:hypothetical protein
VTRFPARRVLDAPEGNGRVRWKALRSGLCSVQTVRATAEMRKGQRLAAVVAFFPQFGTRMAYNSGLHSLQISIRGTNKTS